MARSDIRVRGEDKRRRMHSRQYFVWVADHKREVKKRAETFEVAFIRVVREVLVCNTSFLPLE